MKTNDLKVKIALWLESLVPRLPKSWSLTIRWVARKVAGHNSRGVLFTASTESAETFVSTSREVLVFRFVRLGLNNMSNEKIKLMFRDQGLKPARPEDMEVITQNLRHCPDGRLIAAGGDGEHIRVFWKKGEILNKFWFSRNITHSSGDFAVGIVL